MNIMNKLTLLPLAALLVISSDSTHAQSAGFIVSQHGKAVGTANFNFTATSSGYDSKALVSVKLKGLDYSLSKTERLNSANQLRHVELTAKVNGTEVNVTADPEAAQIPLVISSNGNTSSSDLAAHAAAVFLPDFDPGALETLLALGVASNNRDLWAIIPKKAGSIEPIKLATYGDEKGTLDGQPIVVHHLVATIAGASTDIFSGPDNQLLQAELPQPGFALVRKGFVLTPPTKPGPPPTPPPAQPTQ